MPVPRMQRPWLWFCALYAGEVMEVARWDSEIARSCGSLA